MLWYCTDTRPEDEVAKLIGFIPDFLSEDDPRPAREQINENYSHGGGWLATQGFSLEGGYLCFEGDDPLAPVAYTHLREEKIIIYPYGWIVVQQPDHTIEVARID
jgi:hypothetical protein